MFSSLNLCCNFDPKVLPNDPVFLEPPEEMTLCKYYEKRLLEFCSVFKPAMPRSVVVSSGVLEFNVLLLTLKI